jgi:hypothetical protein
MWTVGEAFVNITNGITVSVLSTTSTGFEVQIEKRPVVPTIIYVDADATGANDGSSWDNAYADLQDALAVANPTGRDIVEIWVADGAYTPTSGVDRNATFQLKDNVIIYGGFDGTETDRSQRDITAHPTILSGDLQGNDNDNIAPDEPTRAENSYHVVTGSGSTGTIDGVIITGGNANGDSASNTDSGGGMYSSSGNPNINQVTFRGNVADFLGGGMYNRQSSPNLANVIFSGNMALFRGGGMYNVFGSAKLVNVTFSGNTATFFLNSEGGGVYNYSSSTTIANSIFWDNRDMEHGNSAAAQLANNGDGSFDVTYSLVQGTYTGTGNISGDPLFVDADGLDDTPGTADDNLRLQATSPAIDAGNNNAVPAGVSGDMDGNSRFFNHPQPDTGNGTPPIVDMGAYEATTGIAPALASVEKAVLPLGQVNFGDTLTYFLVISATPGTQVGLYDPLEGTTFTGFVEQPPGVTHSSGAITGTLTVTPSNHITVSFVAQVGVPGTTGMTVNVTNRACVIPFGGTLDGCTWSNGVTNPAFRPYSITTDPTKRCRTPTVVIPIGKRSPYFNRPHLHRQPLLPTNDCQCDGALDGPFGQEAMQIVNAPHRLLIDGHDQVTLAQAGLARRTTRFDRHDFDRSLIRQVVEPHQAAMEGSFAGGDPQIAAAHPAMREELRDDPLGCVGGNCKANALGHHNNRRVDPNNLAPGVQ